MDVPFKSPRPPAPRAQSRGSSMSRAARSQQSHQEQENSQDDSLTASGLLGKLEGLLVAKSNEIQLAGRLGEALLNQQAELEERIRELEEDVGSSRQYGSHMQRGRAKSSDEDSILGGEAKEKLHALENELKRWERDNEEIYRVVSVPGVHDLARQPSNTSSNRSRPSTPPPRLPTASSYIGDSSTILPLDSASVALSPSASRRERNGQHRANDIEFATEIGQSLLQEVRRLQALLSERDVQLAASKGEKDSMERSMESLASGLKSVEENLDKYREENWNLEVRNQEIVIQISEVSGNLSKVDSERARLARELSGTRENLDSQKVENERMIIQVENLKVKHETDMANMRRLTAGLQRDKSDLQASLEGTKNDLIMRTRGIRRSVSAASGITTSGEDISIGQGENGMRDHGPEEQEEEDEEDVFGTNRRGTLNGRRKTNDHLVSPGFFSDNDNEPRSSDAQGGWGMNVIESEKLQASLTLAQRTIQTLRGALVREKQAKLDLRMRLGGKGEHTKQQSEINDVDLEDNEEVDENQPEKRRKTITGPTRNRRGAGGLRGGLPARRSALTGRPPRALQPSRLSAEVSGDNEAGSDTSDVSIIEHADISFDSEEEEELASTNTSGQRNLHDDVDMIHSARGSLADMDPAFAQLLPSLSSDQSLASATGNRGMGSLGSLTKDNRPSSAMFANNFNLEHQLRKQEKILAVQVREVGTSTEPDPKISHMNAKICQLEEAAEIAFTAALVKQGELQNKIDVLSAEVDLQKDRVIFEKSTSELQERRQEERIESFLVEQKNTRSEIKDLTAQLITSKRVVQEAGDVASFQARNLQLKVDQLLDDVSKTRESSEEAKNTASAAQSHLQTTIDRLEIELQNSTEAAKLADYALTGRENDFFRRIAELESRAEAAKLTAKQLVSASTSREADLQRRVDQMSEEAVASTQSANELRSAARAAEKELQLRINELTIELESTGAAAKEAADVVLAKQAELEGTVVQLTSKMSTVTESHKETEEVLRRQSDEQCARHAETLQAAKEAQDSLKSRVEELIEMGASERVAAIAVQSRLQGEMDALTQDCQKKIDISNATATTHYEQILNLTRDLESSRHLALQTQEQLQKRIEQLNKRAEEASQAAQASEGDLQKQVDRMSSEAELASTAASVREHELQNNLLEHQRLAKKSADSAVALQGDLLKQLEHVKEKAGLLASSASVKEVEYNSKINCLQEQIGYTKRSAKEREETLRKQVERHIYDASVLTSTSLAKESVLRSEMNKLQERAALADQSSKVLESNLRTQIEDLQKEAKSFASAASTKESELCARLAQLDGEVSEAKEALMTLKSSENSLHIQVDHLNQGMIRLASGNEGREKLLKDRMQFLIAQTAETEEIVRQREVSLQDQVSELKQKAARLAFSTATKEAASHAEMTFLGTQNQQAMEAALSREAHLREEITRLNKAAAYRIPKIDVAIMTEALPIIGTSSLRSHSNKIFERTCANADWDTATETEGDFEDARETLAAIEPSPHVTGNLSHTPHASENRVLESDQESEFDGLEATPRYQSKRRTRRPTNINVKETGTNLVASGKESLSYKKSVIDIGIQTEKVQLPKQILSMPSMEGLPRSKNARRISSATFGAAGQDRRDGADESFTQGTAPNGLIYIEQMGLTPSPFAASTRSSIITDSYDGPGRSVSPLIPSPGALKARPPKLAVPPPPGIPPPSDLHKRSTTPTFRPPRPNSPPPADLLKRAKTPTLNAPSSTIRKRTPSGETAALGMAGVSGSMHLRNEASLGASPAPLPNNKPPRAVASAAQLRSAPPIRYHSASTGPIDTTEFGRPGIMTPIDPAKVPTSRFGSTQQRKSHPRSSGASIASSMGSDHSRGMSIASSRTSEIGANGLPTPDEPGRGFAGLPGGSTDPIVIHAITQTMIGEFLFKYTRGTFSKETSEKRHQRFFWIHPYTKTLYWSNADPGAAATNQSKAKSVFIAGVRTETDANPYPPGLYQTSIIVHTVGREIKLTAPTQERHEMWMTAINYLLGRPDDAPAVEVAEVPGTPTSGRFSNLGRSMTRSASSLRFRQKSEPSNLTDAGKDTTIVPANRGKDKRISDIYKHETMSETRITPKPARRKMSSATNPSVLYKRSDTPAAEYQHYLAEFGSPRSVRSYRLDHDLGDESMEIIERKDVMGAEEGYEGLENVRACCNGEHDVGKLSTSKRAHHDHTHNHKQRHGQNSATTNLSSRHNSVASRTSSHFGKKRELAPPIPLPAMNMLGGSGALDDPGSPSLRARSLSSTNKRRSTINDNAPTLPMKSSNSSSQLTNLFRSTTPLPTTTVTRRK